jgi:S-adenosyl-L-methionine hydrolase (adenosine-forming)
VTYDWISFTTDYGLDDGFVTACVGVIARIAPRARMLHVTHRVPAQDIRRGATVLAQTVPYLPQAVHLAVVDPGVGTARRPLALVTANGLLVGPDNGLLVPAAEALGGIVAAHELTERAYQLAEVSATFHGRDLFAPAAAHLAAGVPPDRLGPAVDPATLVRLRPLETAVEQGVLRSEILSVDGFGNIQLAATRADLEATGCAQGAAVRVRVHDRSVEATIGRTFHDVQPGAMVVLVDSAGHAALAANGGSAARELTCAAGDTVTIRTDGQ